MLCMDVGYPRRRFFADTFVCFALIVLLRLLWKGS